MHDTSNDAPPPPITRDPSTHSAVAGDGNQAPATPYMGYSYPAERPSPEPSGESYYAPAHTEQADGSARRYAVPVGLVALSLFLIAAAYLIGGEAERFINVGLQFAPLALLAALTYGGVRNSVAAVFAYIMLALTGAALLLNALVSVFGAVANLAALQSARLTPASRLSLDAIFKPGADVVLLWTAILLVVAAVIAGSMLLRPVRAFMARIIPIDPDNFVHKIGLSLLTLMLLCAWVPLIVLGGRSALIEILNSGVSGIDIRPTDLVYQFVWILPATLIATGWLVARNFRAVMVRLNMVVPTPPQVLIGIGVGVGMAALYAFVLGPVVHFVWTQLGWPTTDEAALERLLGSAITPIGAVIIGVTAGVGEEMAFRGLLQPRIGLIFANLLFASIHAQYALDGLVIVFIVGLALGLLRARFNTSTAAIAHGMYNFTLVMASVLLMQQ